MGGRLREDLAVNTMSLLVWGRVAEWGEGKGS